MPEPTVEVTCSLHHISGSHLYAVSFANLTTEEQLELLKLFVRFVLARRTPKTEDERIEEAYRRSPERPFQKGDPGHPDNDMGM
jgi:hypothetical protein